jgi:two-component system chemotaxis sensor kinase CheA
MYAMQAFSMPPRRENVVVVQFAGHRTELVVDRLQGEFQTVIKPRARSSA